MNKQHHSAREKEGNRKRKRKRENVHEYTNTPQHEILLHNSLNGLGILSYALALMA